MRLRLLKWISCPACHGELQLREGYAEESRPGPPARDEPFWVCDSSDPHSRRVWDVNWSTEVYEGELNCVCGRAYPVVRGVPRLLGAPKSGPAGDGWATEERTISSRTQACYNYLWRYKSERMGWKFRTYSETDFFLRNMGLEAQDVVGKVLLDAGCGDGRLTSVVASLGIETVGIDMSEGVDIGFARNDSPLVHYVQGDLLRPPLKRKSFDLVWSWGVLHHTRNTKLAFEECARLLRPGGRMFLWLYDKAPRQRQFLIWATQNTPVAVKRLISRSLEIGNKLKKIMGRENEVTQTQSRDEVYFWNMDMYGPEFRHLHPFEEVQGWLRAAGFDNVTRRGRMDYGFGVTADLGAREDGQPGGVISV